ncbi:MAG TPA: hypothetical protein VKZ85_00800 [Woeseiaceae bacterium]|nr:hypothetical protein [Woeseiaceae bacterium]
MADEYTATIRIRRPAKVTTDDRGRTVWTGTIETAELELVSTAELEQLLAQSDEQSRTAIEQVLATDAEGVLARDPTTGLFQIVSEAEVAAALEKDRGSLESLGGEELSLVSTQVLRRRLDSRRPERERPRHPARPMPAARGPKRDAGGGFDPYNNG